MNVNNVNILSPAIHSENPSPVKPDPMLNMAIAAVIGLMLGVGIAFLLEYLDTTIKTEQDAEEFLGLPILGLVSTITDKDIPNTKQSAKRRRKEGVTVMFKKKKKPVQTVARKLVTNVNPKSIVSEQFRTVRTNINFSMPDKDLKTLLFTSILSGGRQIDECGERRHRFCTGREESAARGCGYAKTDDALYIPYDKLDGTLQLINEKVGAGRRRRGNRNRRASSRYMRTDSAESCRIARFENDGRLA